MKKKFLNFLTETCVIFTVICCAINLVLLFRYSSADNGANFSSGRMLLFLPCALFLSAATAVRKSEKITGILCWVLHCVFCVCGLFFFAVLPGVGDQTGAQKLVGFFVTLFVYLVIVLVIATVFRRVKRAEQENQKYKKKF